MDQQDRQDTLQFYAFSKDVNAGEGAGDIVKCPTDYIELNKIKNWRRMFSSFWDGDPFVYNGKTYLSFEHAYQSSKYRINGNTLFADKFAIESKDPISKMVGKDVQKAGRMIKLKEDEIVKWDVISRTIKDEIYHVKYTNSTNPGKALVATGNARLINAGPRIKKIHCTRLEALREKLK
jgi:predicted NAD-dependent protein-ADP-ribosyltransferase YbiA (DUF1768 family)